MNDMPIALKEEDREVLREPVQAFTAQAKTRGEARGMAEERLRLLCDLVSRRHHLDAEELRANLSLPSDEAIAATWDRALSGDELDEVLRDVPGRGTSFGH